MATKLYEKQSSTENLILIISSLIISLSFSFACYSKKMTVLPIGPQLAIGEVTKSIVESGSLIPKYFREVEESVRESSRSSDKVFWQDVFALDRNGDLFPKHSIFSIIVAVPFYFLFGEFGFWLLQQLMFLWLLYSIYLIVKELSGQELPCTTIVSAIFLSPIIFYSYLYSFDLHGAALIIGGLCLMINRPFRGGMVMALSLFVRPAYILLVLPLALTKFPSLKAHNIRKSIMGVFLVVAVMLLFNYIIWGDVFSSSYSRVPNFYKGEMIISAHPVGFDLNVLFSDWYLKIFGQAGLVSENYSILALPLVLVYFWSHKSRKLQIQFLLIGLVYTIYIFSYPMWMVSGNGNRFLLPAICLYLFSFILMLGEFEVWVRRKLANKGTFFRV